MPANHKLEIVQRRQKVAELHLQGLTQGTIAEELGVSQTSVARDLTKIERSWRESAIRDFDAAREKELQRLALIEKNAWDAWKRSCQPLQSATVDGQAADSQKARRTVKHQNGQPRFLELVLNCIDQRAKLLGLEAPLKMAETSPDGRPLTRDERQAHIDAILRERFGVQALPTTASKQAEGNNEPRETADAPGGTDRRGADEAQPGALFGPPREVAAP